MNTLWIVLSGLVEDMELTNFEGVFSTFEKAEAYVKRCNAELAEDGNYYNSAEIYFIREEKVI